MNAFCVVFDNIVLRSRVAHRGFLPFPVTTSAEIRDSCREGRRIRVNFALHRMSSVTLFARWTVRVIVHDKLSVHAFLVLLADFRMTRGTIHLLHEGLARTSVRNIHSGMTLAARCF